MYTLTALSLSLARGWGWCKFNTLKDSKGRIGKSWPNLWDFQNRTEDCITLRKALYKELRGKYPDLLPQGTHEKATSPSPMPDDPPRSWIPVKAWARRKSLSCCA